MKIKPIALVLFRLSITAAFSTTSLSTVYYDVINSSTVSCQPKTPLTDSEGLRYLDVGIRNESSGGTRRVMCPVNVPPTSNGGSYTYDFKMVVYGTQPDAVGYIECKLKEIQNFDKAVRQVHVAGAIINGTTNKLLSWTGIARLAPENASAFIIKCDLPENSGLSNITAKQNG